MRAHKMTIVNLTHATRVKYPVRTTATLTRTTHNTLYNEFFDVIDAQFNVQNMVHSSYLDSWCGLGRESTYSTVPAQWCEAGSEGARQSLPH